MSTFDLEAFAGREQRRVERLTRAAYGVGGEHAWFRALGRPDQVGKVQEWVEDALAKRHARLSGIPFRYEGPLTTASAAISEHKFRALAALSETVEVMSENEFRALLALVPEEERAALLDKMARPWDSSDEDEDD